MNWEDVALAVIYAPGISHGFVQPYCGLDEKQTKGESVFTLKRSFRVVLWSDKKMADEERETLPEAVAAAFGKLGLPMPNLEPEPFE